MFKKTSENYDLLMLEIKKINGKYKKILSSKEYKILNIIKKTIKHEVGAGYIKCKFYNLIGDIKCKVFLGKRQINNDEVRKQPSNYYFPHKIAVYTCIIGNYDKIQDPFIVPDNCDFYLYCDKNYRVNSSVWKRRNIDDIIELSQKLSPLEKNRFIKMCPHILFPEYEYSFYVDGNIKIMTDISEYMHNIGGTGISMHRHYRACVYKEAKAVKYCHKVPKYEVSRYITFLKESGMPVNYGMLSCGIIAREHHNELCIRLMEEWWKMFQQNIQRDQLLLPYILFKLEIDIDKIATMPGVIWDNDSFLFFKHN